MRRTERPKRHCLGLQSADLAVRTFPACRGTAVRLEGAFPRGHCMAANQLTALRKVRKGICLARRSKLAALVTGTQDAHALSSLSV